MRINRALKFFLIAIGIMVVIGLIGGCAESSKALSTKNNTKTNSASTPGNFVPWDYRVEEKTVGDLIGVDMTLLPDNQLLANDENYATGDKVWTMSYMNAEMKTDSAGRADVVLSTWTPIKSYKTKAAADADLENLKVLVDTSVDLVGVYKTESSGKFREFAVITLPSGNEMKQPISEERYIKFKDKKTVKVTLETVHDYENYDETMAKFRGWKE
ncbi:hypothetical protein [Paenibacillus psychroresistens]|uniref:hypothetical protein n=1 Tax=Paenibacillus psychroresistens TaxID=1778678 RepID=UPI001D043B5D|nr:hypothetical protein [Paenibacillus psychroresistens]